MNADLLSEATDALWNEYELRGGRGRQWVMSREWWLDLRNSLGQPGASVDLPHRLIGLPIEVREDAGFPRLVEVSA